MKIKILGSGSSGNCYLLQTKEETLILECGIRYKDILKGLNFNLKNVVGCLVTHEHIDHAKSIIDILKDGIDVYTSFGTARAIADKKGCIVGVRRLKYIKSEIQFKIGNFAIIPFETEHDAAEPLGFLIYHKGFGKLLFITDSYYCKYNFSDVKHIMIECNYSEEILQQNIENRLNPAMAKRLLKSHMSLENCKNFLMNTDLNECESITLLHLSDGNSNAKEFKNEIERVTGKPVYVADKGLELEF